MLFFKDKPIIGIDISSTGIKVMAIDTKRSVVLGYGSVDLDPAQLKESFEENSSYLAENIKKLLNEKLIGTLPSKHVILGLPTARSFSRTFTLPSSAENNLREAVEIEADQYIPVPSSTLYIDYEIIGREKKEITILMSAISRVIVDNCVDALESAKLQVALVEPSISAVGRLITIAEDGHLPTVIVDIGPASTDIAVLVAGFIRVTGGLAIGGNTFTLDIAQKLGVPVENAHQLKVINGMSAGPKQQKIQAALQPSLEKITAEIKKVMRYYNDRLSDDKKLEQLLVVGAGSNVPGIGEYFTDKLVMPARVASPWQMLDFGNLPEPAKQFRSRYITVAGLASVKPSSIWK